MSISYHVLNRSERVTHLILALCCFLFGVTFIATAWGFDSDTAKGSGYFLAGQFDSSIVPEQFESFNPDPQEMESPRTLASIGFVFLTGLAVLAAINLALIAAFSTLAFFEIVFFLGDLAMIVMAAVSFYRVFSVGGAFGLLPLLLLAAECTAVCFFGKFIFSRIG